MTTELEELADWRPETALSAIRETQLDHGKKLDAIEAKLDILLSR
jgi:hypothetical protein